MAIIHPLVRQLRFTRAELMRALDGVSDADARQRIMPMNSISWSVGHLAAQEQRYWLTLLQDLPPVAMLDALANGQPASTPPLDETWGAWHAVIDAADGYLDNLTSEHLAQPIVVDGEPSRFTVGSMVQRVIYHYWFHTGECMAVRAMLGHTNLPQFVGNIDAEAPYVPE